MGVDDRSSTAIHDQDCSGQDRPRSEFRGHARFAPRSRTTRDGWQVDVSSFFGPGGRRRGATENLPTKL